MTPPVSNLFEPHGGGAKEQFKLLLHTEDCRLEQIVSCGQASDPGFWYDQPQPEWVALLRGSAKLEFENETLDLAAGDYLLIPAHCRHRVQETSLDVVWLALHFHEKTQPESRS